MKDFLLHFRNFYYIARRYLCILFNKIKSRTKMKKYSNTMKNIAKINETLIALA